MPVGAEGFAEGGNNGAFRYSQNNKERRPGNVFNASGGNAFNAAVFHRGRTWSRSQPNRRLRLVQLIGMGGVARQQ